MIRGWWRWGITGRFWLVGNYGTVLTSTDGGENWRLVEWDVHNDLQGISVIEQDKLVICGHGGVIIKTDFSFDAIQTAYFGDSLDLNVVEFSTDEVGFCAGSRGVLLKTMDGGKHWIEERIFTNYSFVDLSFPDDSTGYLAGINPEDSLRHFGVLLTTENTGTNWTLVRYIPWLINTISFINPQQGYLGGNAGTIYKTFNGGSDWSSNEINRGSIVDIFFEDEVNGWSIMMYGVLYKTIDGGATWTHHTMVDHTKKITKTNSTYFACGQGGVIYSSPSGDGPWERQTKGFTDHLNKVIFLDDQNGFIFGESVMLTTTDGGLTWVKEYSRFQHVVAADFTPSGKGMIADGESVYFTNNKGKDWTKLPSFEQVRSVLECRFVDEESAYITGIMYSPMGYVVHNYRTDNGGESWHETAIANRWYISKLLFLDNGSGFGIGDGGACVKTTDKGANWIEIPIDSGFKPTDISFANHQSGLICGWYMPSNLKRCNRIYQTQDAGDSWELVYEDQTMNQALFTHVFMANESEVYILASGGKIIESNDGGLSWTEGIRSNYLYDIGGKGRVFAVGYYGTILTTDPDSRITFNRQISIENSTQVHAYPNPFSNQVTLEYSLEKDEMVNILVTDIYHKTIWNEIVQGHFGFNYYTLNGSNMAPGIYFITLSMESYTGYCKLLKVQ